MGFRDLELENLFWFSDFVELSELFPSIYRYTGKTSIKHFNIIISLRLYLYTARYYPHSKITIDNKDFNHKIHIPYPLYADDLLFLATICIHNCYIKHYGSTIFTPDARSKTNKMLSNERRRHIYNNN